MLGGAKIETELTTNLKCSNSACYGLLVNRTDTPINKFEQTYGLMCDDCNKKLEDKHSAIVTCVNCNNLVAIEVIPNQTQFMYYVLKCSKCGGTSKDEETIYPPNYFSKPKQIKLQWQSQTKGLPLLKKLKHLLYLLQKMKKTQKG